MDARPSESGPEGTNRRQSEKLVLRVLCSQSMKASKRGASLSRLTGYAWADAEHRVVYDAIARCREMDAAAMRAELQSVTTRLGFPDLDLSEYFGDDDAADVTADELEHAIETLLGKRGTDEE